MWEAKMGKTGTLRKQKKSKNKSLREHIPFKSDIIRDRKVVTETLLDCIRTGDMESFREVLTVFLISVNKTELTKKAGIGRRTLYDLIDPNKEFNPELSTISSLIKALVA